jgi:hypothetical protein
MKKENLLMTAIAIFGLATITMAQVPSYVPTNGLVGYWPFNGNANDESGNGNNGTVNGATLTSDRFGNANSSYSFDGIDDFIEIPNSSSISNPNLTIGFWINTNSVVFQQVLYKVSFNTAQNEEYSIPLNLNNQNEINLDLKNNSCSPGIGWVSFNNSAVLSNWKHVIFTHDGSITRFFLDGILINSQNANFNIANCPGGSLILGIAWDLQNAFNGALDDIGIWNRALTQQEITDLYNGCQLSVNTQPTNQTINVNNNAQFVVSSSDPGSTYQWQTDLGVGYQNLNSVGQYSGTTNDTLTVANVTLSNNNQPFRCIISSGSCTDTSDVAVLTVNNNVGINETSQDNLFTVFPNPAQNIINVKVDNKLIGKNYSIYDNSGRIVLTGKLNFENTTIELGNLLGGIYMFSVGENMKQTFKVIKE